MGRLLLGFVAVLLIGLAAGATQAAPAAQGTEPTPQPGGTMPPPDPAAVARGEAVFHQQVVCTTCHTLNGDGGTIAVELKTVGHRFAYLARTERLSPVAVMEGLFGGAPAMQMVRATMTDQQVADVAAYLTTLQAPLEWDPTLTMEEAVQGLRAYAGSGCPACHTLSGVGATERDEAIPLVGIRHKNSQEATVGKLERIGAGPPGQGMRDAWASVSPEDRRAILAFLYHLD
jgi:mono/diheme cytochrome c family protein